MKSLAIAALLALTAGTVTAANAVEFNVGPGGVRIDPGYHRYYRGDRDNCRIVIDHHTNRFGEDVTVRRRICD
jgi:hypothetical protein